MKNESIKKIYKTYSGVYDLIFKSFFHPRQKLAINDINFQPGDRILDVGVGTGLSLPLYPESCDVTGVDLSSSMLRQAKKKVEKLNLTNVTLIEMDACDLEFEDNTFDYVVATHIISVVPEPVKVINEMRRVTKPEGKLVIVNHFVSSKPWIARVENFLDPAFRKLGWRMDMNFEDFITSTNLDVLHTTKLNKIDLWRVVHAKNNKHLC
ncbi:Phosphatidylethanolamine N-methyltransferase [hydrothermal vent metagenome]|uniref:Phosphatidylethanolamine N-methyltransferase n=1 Tax=hydrothermal vent metagenome TaxID=652676 RepID=A0A3B1CGL0_9ZZZZ